MIYGYLVAKNGTDSRAIVAGNISLKKWSEGLLQVTIGDKKEITPDLLNTFETDLRNLLSEIYNPATCFSQTEELQQCSYCEFKSICNR